MKEYPFVHLHEIDGRVDHVRHLSQIVIPERGGRETVDEIELLVVLGPHRQHDVTYRRAHGEAVIGQVLLFRCTQDVVDHRRYVVKSHFVKTGKSSVQSEKETKRSSDRRNFFKCTFYDNVYIKVQTRFYCQRSI